MLRVQSMFIFSGIFPQESAHKAVNVSLMREAEKKKQMKQARPSKSDSYIALECCWTTLSIITVILSSSEFHFALSIFWYNSTVHDYGYMTVYHKLVCVHVVCC